MSKWHSIGSVFLVLSLVNAAAKPPPEVNPAEVFVDTDTTEFNITGKDFNHAAHLNSVQFSALLIPTPTGVVTYVNDSGEAATVQLSAKLSVELVGERLALKLNNNDDWSTVVQVTAPVALGVPTIAFSLKSATSGQASLLIYGQNFAKKNYSDNRVHVTCDGCGCEFPAATVTSVATLAGRMVAGVSLESAINTCFVGFNLTAVLTNSGGTTQPTQISGPVALGAPTVNKGNASVNTDVRQIQVFGENFDGNNLHANHLTFSAVRGNLPQGTVTGVSDYGASMTVHFKARLDTDLIGEVLQLTVSNTGGSSMTPVTVTSVIRLAAPVINNSTNANVTVGDAELAIYGENFAPTVAQNTLMVYAEGEEGSRVVTGHITAVGGGGSNLTFQLNEPLGMDVFNAVLIAQLTTHSAGAGAQVSDPAQISGPIRLGVPFLNSSELDVTTDTLMFNISGSNFDPRPAHNILTLQTSVPGDVLPACEVIHVWDDGSEATVRLAQYLSVEVVGAELLGTLTTAAGVSEPVQLTNAVVLGAPMVTAADVPLTTDSAALNITGRNFDTFVTGNSVIFHLDPPVPDVAPTGLITAVTYDAQGQQCEALVEFGARLDTRIVGSRLVASVITMAGPSEFVPVSAHVVLDDPTIVSPLQDLNTDSANITLDGTNFAYPADANRVRMVLRHLDGSEVELVGAVVEVFNGGASAVVTWAELLPRFVPAHLWLSFNNSVGATPPTDVALVALGDPLVHASTLPLDTNAVNVTIEGHNFPPRVNVSLSLSFDDDAAAVAAMAAMAAMAAPPRFSVLHVNDDGSAILIGFDEFLSTELVGACLLVVVHTGAGDSNGGVPTPIACIHLADVVVDADILELDTDAWAFNITGLNLAWNASLNTVQIHALPAAAVVTGSVVDVWEGGRAAMVVFDHRLDTALQGAVLSISVSTPAPSSSPFVPISAPIRLAAPVVVPSAQATNTDATSLTITGFNFNAHAFQNSVVFTATGGTPPHGTVIAVENGGTAAVVLLSSLLANLKDQQLLLSLNNTVTASDPVTVTGPIELSVPEVTVAAQRVDTNTWNLTVPGRNFDPDVALNNVTVWGIPSDGSDAVLGPPAAVVAVNGAGTQLVLVFDARMDTALVHHQLAVIVSNQAGPSERVIVSGHVILAAATVMASTQQPLATNTTTLLVYGTNFDAQPANNNVTFRYASLTSEAATWVVPEGVVTQVLLEGQGLVLALSRPVDTAAVGDALLVVIDTPAGSSNAGNAVVVTAAITLASPVLLASNVSCDTDIVALTINGFSFNAIAEANQVIVSSNGPGEAPAVNATAVRDGGLTLVVHILASSQDPLQDPARVNTNLRGFRLWASVNNGVAASVVVPITGVVTLAAPTLVNASWPTTTDTAWLLVAGATNLDPTPRNNALTFAVASLGGSGSAPNASVSWVGCRGTCANVSFVGRLNTNLQGDSLTASLDNGVFPSNLVAMTSTIELADPVVVANALPITTDFGALVLQGLNFNAWPSDNTITLLTTTGTLPQANVTSILNGGQGAVVSFVSGRLNTDLVNATLFLSLNNGVRASPLVVVASTVVLAAPTVDIDVVQQLNVESTSMAITGTNFNSITQLNNVTVVSTCGVVFATVVAIGDGGTSAVINFVAGPQNLQPAQLGEAFRNCILSVSLWNGVSYSPLSSVTAPIFGPERDTSTVVLAIGLTLGCVLVVSFVVLVCCHFRHRPRDAHSDSRSGVSGIRGARLRTHYHAMDDD